MLEKINVAVHACSTLSIRLATTFKISKIYDTNLPEVPKFSTVSYQLFARKKKLEFFHVFGSENLIENYNKVKDTYF